MQANRFAEFWSRVLERRSVVQLDIASEEARSIFKLPELVKPVLERTQTNAHEFRRLVGINKAIHVETYNRIITECVDRCSHNKYNK